MIFERFTDPDLSQYSYAVGCAAAGEVALIDPRRDVDVYLDWAEEQGVEITRVLETHIHADFASGARELAELTGAEHRVSRYDRGEDFEVAFPHTDMGDGDSVTLGQVRIAALHTPGHTPEHLSFLVYDGARSAETPMLMLSGDFLFVGSLGRPDLLGEEAKRALAESLFRSVREVLAPLPDGLEIHPGHGAGSLCGSGMSGRPVSTLGYERATNPYLDPALTEERFVERILSTVPPFPAYYRRMKRINSEGPALLGEVPGWEALSPEEVARLLAGEGADAEAVVIDLRDQLAFGGGHIPGALGIGAGAKVSTWSSWMAPYDRPLVLVTGADGEGADEAAEAASRALIRVGLDGVRGYLDGGMAAWRQEGRALETVPQMTVGQVREALRGAEEPALRVLDVRTASEWDEGHIEGAEHLMAGHLPERWQELGDRDAPLAVICGSGYRSTVAASLLRRVGFTDVRNITGGMTAWKAAGLPVV